MISYPLSAFMATPPVAANQPRSSGTGRAQVTANVERTEDLDELLDRNGRPIDDSLKVIIAQGFDPRDPKRWGDDRSDALYFVCCELVRCGVRDEVILGLITDSRYLISASVLDKGNRVDEYARRQLGRAKDYADDPRLVGMNDEYAVILTYGSKPMVMVREGRIHPITGRPEPVFQSFRDFKDRVRNLPKIVYQEGDKVKTVPCADWWLGHKRRHEYLDVTFEPGIDTPGRYNLWTSSDVRAIPGDRHLRFIDHVRDVICNEDDRCFTYLINWMARAVQQPRTQSMVAIVLLGDRGTGKSLFCNFFGQIFDPYRVIVSDVNQLTGKFNAHLSVALMVQAEEAFDLKDKRHESVLKDIVTGPSRSVEKKGQDIIQLPNYAKLILTSNSERVVPAGDKERRFLVMRVSDRMRGNHAYWNALLEDMRSGGPANLLHYLMQVDLAGFNVVDVPQTEELRKQQEHNLGAELEWLMSKLETGMWLDGHQNWTGPVLKKQLHADYCTYLEKMGVRHPRGERAFHRFMMTAFPGTTDARIQSRESWDKPMVFLFPPLGECREAFDRARGWSHAWADLETREIDDITAKRTGVF